MSIGSALSGSRRRLAPLTSHPVPTVGLVAVGATIAYGQAVRWTTHRPLGTPLPPFLMSWSPQLRWQAAIATAAALLGALVVAAAIRRVRGAWLFSALTYLVTLGVGLAVSAARLGTAGWTHVFDLAPGGSWEAGREYLPALVWLRDGVGSYVGHYPQVLPYLPTHAKGNPPGPVVAMHLLSITTAGRLTVACVLLGSLLAPCTYLLGRSLGGERRGRVAAALAVCSPSVLIYGFTSVDFVFAALAAALACLLVAGRPGIRAAGCAGAGIAAFFSWVLLAVPAWAVVVSYRREGRAAAARLCGCLVAGIAGVTVALWLAWGYDPISILRAADRIYGAGAAAHRPYAFWLLGSPAAWLSLLGPPIAWFAARSLQRRDPAAVALAGVVAISALSGFTKAETERIWLPYVPLACVAAAATPIRRLTPLLVAMAVETITIELLFGTIW